MVDGGSPGTVIEFRSPRSRNDAPGHAPNSVANKAKIPDQDQERLLSLPFLIARLESESDQVKMWAAYHLVDRWQSERKQFIEHLWRSPLPEIRESAINLIGKHRIEQYSFPLLRVFTANEAGMRASAGIALGRLGYDAARKPLEDWIDFALAGDEPKIPEIESAAESLLMFQQQRYWNRIFSRLENNKLSHAEFLTLFRLLCTYAKEPEEYERLAVLYGGPREAYHDFHISSLLVDLVGRPGISRYFQSRLNGGYPLPVAYRECLRLLGYNDLDANTCQLIEAMEGCTNHVAGAAKFITIASALIQRLVPESSHVERLQSFLRGCLSWLPQWEEAILKVREVEYHLLLSLPLVAVLQHVEEKCLAHPEDEALRISRIYQSPLLSPEFMRRILILLATPSYPRDRVRLGSSSMGGWLWDEEKVTLWKLFTDQLDELDYPFEQVLPQPWDYYLPELMDRLDNQLTGRFEGYIKAGRKQAVDYALAVFRYHGSSSMIDKLLEHFEQLVNEHHAQFLDVMAHLPDKRFLQPLTARYREGERDLARLIRFISDVHGLPHPPAVKEQDSPQGASHQMPTSARLVCPHCHSVYQYNFDALYVNEERIEQRQAPESTDLWIPSPISCKNCGTEVPLEPDESFRQDLYAQLAATRILHLRDHTRDTANNVRLIAFPVHDRKTVNPAVFLQNAAQALQGQVEKPEDVQYLFALGKFYLEIGQWDLAKRAFEKILAGPIKYPRALYYLGVIAFQEKNLYDARVYFSRLVASCSPEEFDKELDNPLEMAEHYLKLLDKREFKRSQFRIISS